MLFRFSSSLALNEVFDLNFGLAYLLACLTVYAIFMGVALALRLRKEPLVRCCAVGAGDARARRDARRVGAVAPGWSDG